MNEAWVHGAAPHETIYVSRIYAGMYGQACFTEPMMTPVCGLSGRYGEMLFMEHLMELASCPRNPREGASVLHAATSRRYLRIARGDTGKMVVSWSA